MRLHAFGEPLRLDDVPEPEPAEGESVLEVRFAGVNPLDVWVTQGTVAGGKQPLPLVPGVEGSGEIEGEPVVVRGGGLGVLRDGLYRERANVPPGAVYRLPDGLDLRVAAAVPVIGSTAWALVHDVGRVGPDDRVLVLGASGGVGSMAAQFARAAGATVIAQTGTPEKRSFLQELGADEVVVAEAADLASAVTPLEPTVAFDPLGDAYTRAAVDALRPFGRIVLFGTSAGYLQEMDLRTLYRKGVSILSYSGTIEPEERVRAVTVSALEAVAGGQARVFVDDVLPLEEAGEGHRRILERRIRGKVLLAL